MRTFFIFFLGVILGSTLGIGGIWTQVVQPAHEELKELESEYGFLESTVNAAVEALRGTAGALRGERVEPSNGSGMTAHGIIPGGADETDAQAIADSLDSLAERLERRERKTRERPIRR